MEASSKCHGHAAPAVSSTAYNHPLLQAQPAAKPACKCGKLRPPRKLHAAVGLWLALFLCLHLAVCVTGVRPPVYEAIAGVIHRSPAGLPASVLLLVLAPMLLQAGSGVYLIAKEGVSYSVKRCDRGGKFRYFVQRWSGLAMVSFLLLHLFSMRWLSANPQPGKSSLFGSGIREGAAFASTVAGFHPWTSPAANLLTLTALLAGILLTAFHVANGACSGAILWKLVASDQGKSRLNVLSVVAGILLAAVGVTAWYVFALGSSAQVVSTLR